MSQSLIKTAIQQICQEKNLTEEAVLHAIELALAAAYRKDFGNKLQNIVAEFDLQTGGVKVFDIKTVVEDMPEELLAEDAIVAEAELKTTGQKTTKSFVAEEIEADDEEDVRRFNPKTEIQLSDAKAIDPKYKVGNEIVTSLEVPGEFGRMAAQTAKQVIIQRIREVERENVYNEYKTLEHQVVNGAVQRREGRNVLVDLDKTTAVMPPEEQVAGERYSVGNRMRFYLLAVEQTSRGPHIVVSRSHTEIVRKIFENEIPEVANGVIEIKSIAREAGYRSKVAIISNDENIDPIGSCVGQRGARIQTVISELNGEKVDIILWDENPVKFITNALSPAKVVAVELKEKEKTAKVVVKEDQLSLAIGRAGQNVRLASKLVDWRIDISSEVGETNVDEKERDEEVETTEEKTAKTKKSAKKEPAIDEVATDEVNNNDNDSEVAEKKPKKKKVKKSVEVVSGESKTEEVVEESTAAQAEEEIIEKIEPVIEEEKSVAEATE